MHNFSAIIIILQVLKATISVSIKVEGILPAPTHNLFWHASFQDGRIDYNEFVAMMRKGNGAIGRRTMRNSLNFSRKDNLPIG